MTIQVSRPDVMFGPATGVLMEWFDLSLEQAAAVLAQWGERLQVSESELSTALLHIHAGHQAGCEESLVRRLEELLRHLPAETSPNQVSRGL
ncbi:hypothetical protein [Kribbella deserti]|uniref:ANTAR domain-containing protein n=1 Tax=Kribbella deserti TaxID=1926257 RepID=A0ABV6QER9_9ACTN